MSQSPPAQNDRVVEFGPPRRASAWAWLPLLILLAGAIHVAFLYKETGPGEGLQRLARIRLPDEQNYYLLCADGVATHGLAFLKDEQVLRSPPLAWLWILVWNRNIACVRLANIALILLGSYLAATAARRRFGDGPGLLAFVVCSLNYQTVLFSGTVLTEPLAFFLGCWLLHSLSSLIRTHSIRHAVACGVICGLWALARPGTQLFPIVLAAVMVLFGRSPSASSPTPARRRYRDGLVLFSAYVASVAPWVVCNYVNLGTARIANGFGAVFYLGSDLRTAGDEPVFSGMQWQTGQVSRPFNHMQTEGDRRLMRGALDNIRQNPLDWLALAPRKVFRTLIGGPKWHFGLCDNYAAAARRYGSLHTAVVFVWWTLIGTTTTLFGLAGLCMLRRSDAALSACALSAIGYLLALHAVSYALPRFSVPLSPFLALGCAAFVGLNRRRWLTGGVAAMSLGIATLLAQYHRYIPSHLVPASSLRHFASDRRWGKDECGALPLELRCAGIRPQFNSCVLVRATAGAGGGAKAKRIELRLRPAGSPTWDEAVPVSFALLNDGAEHWYRVCVELASGWPRCEWDSIRIATDPTDRRNVRIDEVIVAH